MDIEPIAAAIHDTWRALSRAEGWSLSPALDRPFAHLPNEAKADSRAAARRIPVVLAVARLGIRPTGEAGAEALAAAEVRERLERAMEVMAEAEHDGWMATRAAAGWRWGETRDDAGRRHPSMKPYAELAETEKAKDRSNVRHYPEFVARAGYDFVSLCAPGPE